MRLHHPNEKQAASLLLAATLAVACSSTPNGQVSGFEARDLAALGASSVADLAAADRKMIRAGRITVIVPELGQAIGAVERLVAEAGGYVEQSNVSQESSGSLQCRVPTAKLEQVMAQVADLGEERDRSISSEDVTDEYADLETRLKNNLALRDRLQALLDRATKVEDVLAIEKELNRVQSEVESMQGYLERLSSQVELSQLAVTLERKQILGPLGYVGYGLWWAVSKLFVIR